MKTFTNWLKAKIGKAKLSAGEAAEFTAWLFQRKPVEKRLEKPEASTNDIREFFHWLESRMSDAQLNENECQLLKSWLVERINSKPNGDLEVYRTRSRQLAEPRTSELTAPRINPIRAREEESRELYSWLQQKMDEAHLSESERAELTDWLSQRLTGYKPLDSEETERKND